MSEVLLPTIGKFTGNRQPTVESTIEDLNNGFRCLAIIFGHYAFARRGKDRQVLAHIALQALKRTTSEDDFGQFLALPDASRLWEAFVEVAKEQREKPMEQLNRGAVAGLAELAQEIYSLDGSGSIAAWIAKGVRTTGRIEPQFLRMVDVRGVGPKLTSLILRDVAYLYRLEEILEPADKIYIQPIDKWIRLLAPYVIDEEDADTMADWILAGKLTKYTRRAGVSGIRFNMGATYFGMKEVHVQENLERAISKVLSGPAS